MSVLTLEERVEQLEECVAGLAARTVIITDTKGIWCRSTSLSELRIKDCPVCKHGTFQVFGGYDNQYYCLTCGHKLSKRIVAID